MGKPKNPAILLYSTELSASLSMKGDLETKGSLLIKGSYSGTIASNSDVRIEKGANVGPCRLSARSVSVKGGFAGSIEASSLIEIGGRATVSADLEAPFLSIAESSSFEGRIKMPDDGD
ncbi:MAG: polymer-forming cytoskeletal protein [Spirochaetes bacterium]|nr:polymer-forming cytoskeletal protein [Spirochaetota bacterium]